MLGRHLRFVGLVAAGLLLLSACAQRTHPPQAAQGSASSPTLDPGRYINWKAPFGADAPSFDQVSEAQASLPLGSSLRLPGERLRPFKRFRRRSWLIQPTGK